MAPFLRSRRTRLLQLVAAAILLVTLSACMEPGPQSVYDTMNADRNRNGRGSLMVHGELNKKAQAWAEHLARRGSLAHSTLSSGLPSCWRGAGENVGYGPSVSSVENAYMNSSGHRANILSTSWDFVGVGHATAGGRVYTVHVFMKGCR